jgi:hypothetical protein
MWYPSWATTGLASSYFTYCCYIITTLHHDVAVSNLRFCKRLRETHKCVSFAASFAVRFFCCCCYCCCCCSENLYNNATLKIPHFTHNRLRAYLHGLVQGRAQDESLNKQIQLIGSINSAFLVNGLHALQLQSSPRDPICLVVRPRLLTCCQEASSTTTV